MFICEPKPSPRPRLARMLRQWREQNGLSQQDVAKQCALSRNYISLIEQGKATNISIGVICALAAAMEQYAVEVFRWSVVEEVPDEQAWIPTCDNEWIG